MAEKSNDCTPTAESKNVTSTQEDNKYSAGGWWDSWLSSAKTKSAEVYSMVRHDLDEIGSAMKSEASHVFTTTSTVIGKTLKLDEPESPANVMKKSLSTFIGQVSTVLNPEPDDEEDTEVILSSGDTTMLSTYKKELEALQRVDATFIVTAFSPEYDAWRSSVENTDGVIIGPATMVRRLESYPILKSQYEKLVPDAVSHEEFWERYLFRVALLQDRLAAAARKQPLEETSTDPVLAHLPLQSTLNESPKKTSDDSNVPATELDQAVAWEDEDFADDVELTEEQQILLLEEYEKEITSKKQTKQTNTKDVKNNNKDKMIATKVQRSKAKFSQTDKMNNRLKSPKKGKSDECGNNLVEDHFAETDGQNVKDDASSNSDESWEKEFDLA